MWKKIMWKKIMLGAITVGAVAMLGTRDGKPPGKQTHMTPDETKVEVVPITEEQHHHLVLDNEYVRVFHVEVAPHAETRYHQHDMDYVFVTLGDSVVESVRVGEKPVKLELKDGDTRFTKGGFAHKAVNLSDRPFVNVTVELKKPVELQPCKPCIDTVLENNTDTSKVRYAELLSSADGVVYMWSLSGKFDKHPNSKSMPRDFLMIPLTNFKLTYDSHSYKIGEALWWPRGTYYWSSKSEASFITIEFGPCSMKRGPAPDIAPC